MSSHYVNLAGLVRVRKSRAVGWWWLEAERRADCACRERGRGHAGNGADADKTWLCHARESARAAIQRFGAVACSDQRLERVPPLGDLKLNRRFCSSPTPLSLQVATPKQTAKLTRILACARDRTDTDLLPMCPGAAHCGSHNGPETARYRVARAQPIRNSWQSSPIVAIRLHKSDKQAAPRMYYSMYK